VTELNIGPENESVRANEIKEGRKTDLGFVEIVVYAT
jgi:hypothetical protein